MSKQETVVIKNRVIVPNPISFFRLTNGGTIPIESLSDSELGEIGCAYRQALIEKARDRRKVKVDYGK